MRRQYTPVTPHAEFATSPDTLAPPSAALWPAESTMTADRGETSDVYLPVLPEGPANAIPALDTGSASERTGRTEQVATIQQREESYGHTGSGVVTSL